MAAAHQTRRENDENVCTCGLRWDVHDIDPHTCIPTQRGRYALDEIKSRQTLIKRVPVRLWDDTANEMNRAYDAAGRGSAGMQAAYRVFLDSLD